MAGRSALDYLSVGHVDRAVGKARQVLIVGHDDKRLAERVAQMEEQLVQLGLEQQL